MSSVFAFKIFFERLAKKNFQRVCSRFVSVVSILSVVLLSVAFGSIVAAEPTASWQQQFRSFTSR
jgi:hypothetical protein